MTEPNTPFQKAADFIEQPEPIWLKNAMQGLQDTIIALAEKAGEAYLEYLVGQVTNIASDTSLTGSQKLSSVISTATSQTAIAPIKALGQSELTTIINGLVSMLKTGGVIA